MEINKYLSTTGGQNIYSESLLAEMVYIFGSFSITKINARRFRLSHEPSQPNNATVNDPH